ENICRDGQRVCVAWTNTPVRDASGRVTEILAVGVDITARKQAEQRLHYFTRLYATLSQVNQTIVRVKDRQELFEAICQVAIDFGEFKLAWIGLLDAASGQVTPMAQCGQAHIRLPFSALNVNEAPFTGGLVSQALAAGQVEFSNDIQLRPDMAHWREAAMRDNYHSAAAIPFRLGGQVVGVLNLYAADINFFMVEEEQKLLAEMGLDISFALDMMQLESDRREAESALRASEAQYRGLFEHMVEGFAYCHMIFEDGQPVDWIYLSVNAAFETLTALRAVTGKPVSEVIPGIRDSNPDLFNIYGRAALTGKPERFETFVAGLNMWFAVSVYSPEPEYFVAVFDVITERKQAEADLHQLNVELEQRVAQRTQELAEANASLTAANARLTELDQLKSKFVSDVSHELRTPVTSLSLYIDLLDHGKPEKRDFYVTQLKGQMTRLRKLIDDILDLSRLERDRDKDGRSPVDINSIVEHVAAMQLVAAETAGLTLTCDVSDGLLAVVARPDQLTRAITNLVANAIKYTPKGSVRVQTCLQGGRVCIQVTDTGLGIPADELPHLFERFYRGRAVAQSTIPGTGLGLSIVKEIIESHDGTVDVASELDHGTTFRIWLPVA
ncbi:MAG: GAF domain-containing protein, partial [Chloroflexi bacterium]|nr:GAF domain-containing protein [Chloroflexota bacterium]